MGTRVMGFRYGMTHRERLGFTLIELLVVVAIIALLVSILVPSLAKARELARRARCSANLHAMGRAWQQYFTENDSQFPGISISDGVSQSSIYIYHNYRITNAGYLWKGKLLASNEVFICPTTDLNADPPWFDDVKGAYPPWDSPNPWPPGKNPPNYQHARMTYGTRRMIYYEQSDANSGDPDSEKPYMLRNISMDNIGAPMSGFSLMADNFNQPALAKMSHFPSVNVLYLGGNVTLFNDPNPSVASETVLYEGNGVDSGQHSGNNWAHDRIWMRIDGTHD